MEILPYIPPKYRRKYPFQEMEVGSVFLMQSDNRSKLSAAATNWGKRHNKKFAIRNYTHEGQEYIACQRIE